MHHKLKCLPPFFQAVLDGRKTFEVRRDDRGFQAGDDVTLREFDPKLQGYCDEHRYTGREASFRIGYVTGWEQQPGHVVFSLLPSAGGSSNSSSMQQPKED